jgi:hypothetical protein
MMKTEIAKLKMLFSLRRVHRWMQRDAILWQSAISFSMTQTKAKQRFNANSLGCSRNSHFLLLFTSPEKKRSYGASKEGSFGRWWRMRDLSESLVRLRGLVRSGTVLSFLSFENRAGDYPSTRRGTSIKSPTPSHRAIQIRDVRFGWRPPDRSSLRTITNSDESCFKLRGLRA